MNALTLLIAFILLILFIQSGHIEILFVLLLVLGLASPEQLAAIARELGKMYYAAKKIVQDTFGVFQGDLITNIGKVGEWRSKRILEVSKKEIEKKAKEKAVKELLGDDELIRKLLEAKKETKGP